MALTPKPSHDVAGVIAEGVGVSLSGGLARRSRVNLKRYNSDPSPSVMDPPSKFVIGVCAMDKKARSKPMTAILQRIMSFNEFEVIVFGDQMILEKPVEDWPLCDCLLSWHSDGFPLAKAQAYVQLRHPFCVNDSLQQEALLDRRMVYQTLKANGIPVPHHIVVSRDHPSDNAENGTTAPLTDPPGFVEELDWVEKDGVRITKPFVEKPVSGENHNIYIYYHSSHGGGVKRLFRKVDDKSADYDSNHPGNVRRDGSYIYEEFLTTGGTDVKVYTVGPRYAHAEARKSPVVDGKVHRASDGKEMRYPVLLSPQEKEISRMVCLAFSQKVCGFDLLRSEKGKSYVCDVNGWSFVKNSTKYLDDAAGILRSMILTALAPQRVMTMPMLLPAPIPTLREEDEEGVVVPNGQRVGQYQSQSMKNVASLQDIAMGGLEDDFNEHEELRCVLAVVRHGDRTPKQKFKCKVSQPALLALFDKHRNSKGDQAKLKNPLQLQEFLGVVRKLVDTASAALADIAAGKTLDSTEHSELGKIKLEKEPIEDFFQQMSIVLTVMEQGGGHFSGVNRKVQLKPVRLRGQDLSLRPSASEPAMMVPPPSPGGPSLTPTPSSTGGGGLQLEEALLVVKWGGVLTHAGRGQAEQLGQQFRATMYPRHGPAGGGLLRLHSTYRHDLKIYSSDEGRVQVSAAAFTKGLLDLEGNSLTPILVSLVNKDASMLEAFGKGASEEMQACKDVIQAQLTHDPAKGPPPPIRAVLPVPSGVQSNASPSPPFSPRPPIIQPGQPRKPPPSTSLSGVPANAATTALGVVRAPSGHLAAPTAVAALAAWNATHAPSPSRGNSPGLPLVPDPRVTPRDMVIVEAPPGASPTSLSQADLGRSVPNLLPVITAPVVSSTPHSSNSSSGGDNGGAASRLGLTLPGSALGGTSLHRTASAAGDAAVPSTPMEQPQSPLVLHIDKLMHMPDQPLALLQSLRSMMRTLVDQLQDMCAKEAADRAAGSGQPPVKAYNSQSQAPDEWELTPTQPCSGEKLVLLHDRWRKLYDAVYSEKKQQFDISKIPDIYDSVKHDAIHNAHLGLPLLKDLYAASKALADVVIPQEYGLEPRSKLSIGSKIAKELVGKLLADMSSMKMESESTAVEMGDSSMVQGSGDELYGPGGDTMATEFGRNCLEDDRLRNRHGTLSAVFNRHSTHAQGAGDEGAGGGGDDLEDSARHRLCPTYASDINSPLRHVRTRIYYTSESHIHSLMNVLRFCYLREGVTTPLVGEEMQKLLDATPENDYLTHVVFRMFENLSMPVGDPARFRVEVLFSPGAACNPITQTPADHTLPVVQLEQLNAGVAQTFHEIENLLAPFAVARKVQASYALSIALKAPSNPLSRNDSSLQSSGVTASMIRSASGNNLKQRSSAGGAHRDSITGRLSNATGSSSSSCLNQLDRTSDSHGTSGGSVSACVHCPESADGSAGGAGGSAMAGLVSKLAKMTSLPIHAKDQQQLAELLQEPTTPRQQRQVAKLLGVDSITPELGDVLDRLEISSASSGPAIILHGLNLG